MGLQYLMMKSSDIVCPAEPKASGFAAEDSTVQATAVTKLVIEWNLKVNSYPVHAILFNKNNSSVFDA